MHKTKFFLGAALALCLMAFSAQAATAQTINGPAAISATNTGPAAGSHVFSIGGTLVVTCTSMTAAGSHNGSVATFLPGYTGCTANIGGIPFPATVTVNQNCSWELDPLVFTAATGVATGSLKIGDGVDNHLLGQADPAPCPDDNAVKIDIGANCDVFVTEQVVANGTNGTLNSQNLTAANTNSPAGGAPANMLINASVNGVDGVTVNCPPGVPVGHFTNGTYAGKMYVANHYIS